MSVVGQVEIDMSDIVCRYGMERLRALFFSGLMLFVPVGFE